MKVGVPLVAGGLVLAGFTSASMAGASTSSRAIPTYTLAYEGPLSGGYQALGLNMKYGVQWAVSKWNQTAGRKFSLKAIFLDDQGDPSKSPTEAHVATSNKNVVGVVGPAFSGATLAAQGVYGPAMMPLVSPSATNPPLGTAAENPHKNFFRIVADDGVQGPADGRYVVQKLKIKKLYVITDGQTYGAGLASQFSSAAKAAGATVPATNTLPPTSQCGGTQSTSEYSTIASLVGSAGLVFYGGYYCDAAILISQLRQQGYHGKFMSGDGTDDPHFVSQSTPTSAANGSYLTCACAQVAPTTAANKQFITGYEKFSHHQLPGTYSAEAYDSTNTFIAAMNAILAAHHSITRANIVAQLHKLVYKGLTKTIKFRAYGDIAGSAIYVNQVIKGKIVQLGLE
jgi:branched-chain amino acid transport system substrate-binding protein